MISLKNHQHVILELIASQTERVTASQIKSKRRGPGRREDEEGGRKRLA
jgi:hypothetical protein